MIFMLAACGSAASDNTGDGTVQNSESTVQENVGGEQTEIQEREDSELVEASENGSDEASEGVPVSDTAGSVVYMTSDISP